MMNWIDNFEGLSILGSHERNILTDQATVIEIPQNSVIFGPGKMPDQSLLLLSGTLRVQQVSEKGREIVLYRVRGGESCVMTSSCSPSLEKYSAEGIAETPISAVAIPMKVFDQLMSESVNFRHFILGAYTKKIIELFRIIEDVAFQRVDIRLAERLLELSSGTSVVHLTHKQLAIELGTAREVISRQLSEFQRRKWLKQSRGVIEITDFDGLRQLACA